MAVMENSSTPFPIPLSMLSPVEVAMRCSEARESDTTDHPAAETSTCAYPAVCVNNAMHGESWNTCTVHKEATIVHLYMYDQSAMHALLIMCVAVIHIIGVAAVDMSF
jgi:hypothetical protein